MQTIYEIGYGGYWTGVSQEIDDTVGAARGWTRTEPPSLEEGEYAVWDGGWIVTTTDPPAVVLVTPDMIDAERGRRIAAGFTFGGVTYQSRDEDRENITGASLAALAAIRSGATAGDYRWHGGASDFQWIAADNSLNTMDAQTMFAFGQAAMAHKQAHIFAARALKDADPIPADYADDGYWPS